MTTSNSENPDDRLILDTSEGRTTYLLVAQNRSHIKLSPSAYQLLRSINSGVSFNALAETLSKQQGRAVTPDEVETAYKHVSGRVEAIERKSELSPSGFWFRLQIFSENVVNTITRPLSFAFLPAVASCLLVAIITACALVIHHGFFVGFSYHINHPTSFWGGYALFLASLIFHEFGHASACARYGARPSGIGFTVYLIYPAFYSDVSAAWQLDRWRRVVVDLGGIFFQLVVGSGYVFLYLLYGWDALRVAVLMIIFSCLLSLNPILKFDGYWVVADALGVVNLGHQPRRVLRHLLARARGVNVPALPWRTSVTAVLVGYAALSFAFWGYFVVSIIPYLWRLLSRYPSEVMAVFGTAREPSDVLESPHLHALFVSTYMLLVLLLILSRMVRPALASIRFHAWSRRGLRPNNSPLTSQVAGTSE